MCLTSLGCRIQTTALHAWSRSAAILRQAPQKSEELLQLQRQLVETGVLDESAQPDSQSYAIVMSTYARSRERQKVHQTYRLLQEMIKGITEGFVAVGASLSVPFTIVLNAAAHTWPDRSGNSIADFASGAPMTQTHDNPFISETGQEEDSVYTIALQTYRELKEDVYKIGCEPDHMAFAAMLEAIGLHTKETSVERRQMIEVVFEDACAAGHISR